MIELLSIVGRINAEVIQIFIWKFLYLSLFLYQSSQHDIGENKLDSSYYVADGANFPAKKLEDTFVW